MPDQDTPLKVMEGVVDYRPGWNWQNWMIGGSDLTELLIELRGKRIKLTIEIVKDE